MTRGEGVEALVRFGKTLDALGQLLEEPAEAPAYVVDARLLRFAFAVDQFWPALQTLLLEEGVEAPLPKQALRAAIAAGWVDDDALWRRLLADRPQVGQGFRRDIARDLDARIPAYYAALRRAHQLLSHRVVAAHD